jgi:glycerol-3-phosphate dehydrogenase
MALKPSDILARRLGTLFLDTNEALSMSKEVVQLMAMHLQKDAKWEEAELKNFTEYAKSYCS